MALSIATWNINSVRLRIDLVTSFLEAHRPDVLCLQEIKCIEDNFPAGAFNKLRQPSAGRDMLQDRLDDVGIVVDAELVRHGQQQRIGLGDRLVLPAAARSASGLGGIRAAEDRALVVDDSRSGPGLAAAEIGAVAVVDQREDAAADRDARLRSWPASFHASR
jgi:hypothetical protein